ncbi:MAG: 16S rRNA (guanine(527)-N(7))-methyltransferase RsmG [Actinobacteria bacterium]|nr:16S rRNA (guanine(527)-N(7))-methyltransferase RsmG [Actinomycetota bacterium]
MLYEGNKHFNITGTKEKDPILTRHIIDSLGIFKYFESNGIDSKSTLRVLDVGTGGGLPGIPVSIFLRNSEFILLDAKGKTIDFLNSVISALGLSNASAIKGRAEIVAHEDIFRESFDIVTSRAMGHAGFLSEIMIPFCRIGGKAIIYKSRKLSEELKGLDKAMEKIGFVLESKTEIKIPFLKEYRVLLVLKKEFSTLYKYPRKYDKMLKMPIFI